MLAVTFHGAARTTTGSMHFVEANGLRILLDCGLHQGHRKEAYERNRHMPIDPATIDFVILTHAHIDHSGNLPTLERNGFSGTIIATAATTDLCDIMLRDSANIQSQDLKFVNKRRRAQGKNLFEPLYEIEDVEGILKRFRPAALGEVTDLGRNVSVVLHEAGHILGSAIVQLDIVNERGEPHRLVFSGDLGRHHQPLIRDPIAVTGADTLIIESTYADRDHPPQEDVLGRLKGFIDDIHQQRAKLIIPAFSVGRTQNILYYLNQLVEKRRIPVTTVYVDSPLATRATKIYTKHRDCYDAAAQAQLAAGDDPIKFPGLKFTRSVEESMALNSLKGPYIIISASGMCEGGRIVHHLRNNLSDSRNIILIVGYQAENTLGRRIVERPESVNIFGEPVEINARIHTINALSAHADRTGLAEWFEQCKSAALKNVFAVHGDPAQTEAMLALLREHGATQPVAPVPGQRFVLSY